MIDRLVLAYGPPKSGMHTTGRILQNNHQWGHSSLRRALHMVGEAFVFLEINKKLQKTDTLPDDIVIPAFMLKLEECAFVDFGKNIFFHGLFHTPTQVRKILHHAARFARKVEVVEFDLPDDEVWKRIKASGDPRYSDLSFGQKAISDYRTNLPLVRKVIQSTVGKLSRPGIFKTIEAFYPKDFVVKQVIRQLSDAA